MNKTLTFRFAKRSNTVLILQFIKELADYEKMLDEVVADAFSSEEVADYAKRVIGKLQYGSNIRGSEQYRKQLSKVLIGRCISRLTEE